MKKRVKYVRLNAAVCANCDGAMVSLHRHHFVSCACEKSFTDGGFDYTHRGGNAKDVEWYARVAK